jgi:NMD protein affecting ribosome stability and mRNA decay
MKKKTRNTCQICGRPITVIIRGENTTEKLCLRCLVASYPALRELSRVV